MLFNSFLFLFGFLPFALIVTFSTGRLGKLRRLVVILLSLGFYAWWRPQYLIILMGSICFNYVVGAIIQRAHAAERRRTV
jgi:alginate O-acetyltransferase complex protein AlgI